MPAIDLCNSIGQLIEKAQSANIRRVLLTDYASVEPKSQHGAVFLVGMITLVVTAFDRTKLVIYRWQEKAEAKQMVSIQAGSGRGPNPGGPLALKKNQIFQFLREEGFEVDDGEWTPQSAETYMNARMSLTGGVT